MAAVMEIPEALAPYVRRASTRGDARDPRDSPKEAAPLPKTVFFGPFIGEFAFEFLFAAVARRVAPWFERRVVCSRPGMQAAYADFMTDFVAHDIECEGACVGAAIAHAPPPGQIARWVPQDGRMLVFHPHNYAGRRWPGTFIKYGAQDSRWLGAVVVHARNRVHVPARNWPPERWHKLARWMRRTGLADRIICVGTMAAAWCIEGALDMRGADLKTQMDVLASARLVIGPSSGPIHLASLCGAPHMCWTGGPECDDVAECYRSHWNPHGTLALPHPWPDWRPPVETVQEWVKEAFKTLETRDGSANRNG